MKDFAYRFIGFIRREAKKRASAVTVRSGGRERVFSAYDWGNDTFIFEKDVWKAKPNHAPVLLVKKDALIKGREGRIMTISSGSHATCAVPLLRGDFWNLGRVPDRRKSDVMLSSVLCANIVSDGAVIEISQRDVRTEEVHIADEWLRGLGWSLDSVVLAERTADSLEFYRRMGQEWRVKPLVWTRSEMDKVLAASRTKIHSDFSYYHSVRGVHFLSFEEFSKLLAMCSVDKGAVERSIAELVRPSEVGERAAMLDPKYRNHHEIELFGIRDGAVAQKVAEMLARLLEEMGSISQEECEDRLGGIIAFYGSALSFPDLADSGSELFVSSMYKHLSGEIYNSIDQVVPAFDDRKTALPGATFRGGKPDFHAGSDERTRDLVSYAISSLSAGEEMEYANVYELRFNLKEEPGKYPTREIEFKTTRGPVPVKLIEKRLAQRGIEYASYMLARVKAFKSLGISFGDHHLLQRRSKAGGNAYYFVRNRYGGYAIDAISRNRLQRQSGGNGEFVDFPEAILRTAAQAGRAAAHTMIVKKYIPGATPVHFGEGKEIIEFDHDIALGCEMPCGMRLCTIRGSLGWPCIDRTPENFRVCSLTYTEAFARTAVDFWRKNNSSVSLDAVMDDFCAGFVSATREIYSVYRGRREIFMQFDPGLKAAFRFRQKWQFALWALEMQFDGALRLAAMIRAEAGRIASESDGAGSVL